MSIPRWTPSQTYSKEEQWLLKRCKRTRRLFRFLREHRDEMFDEGFQEELESMYRGTGAGKSPLPPAQMAMVVLLQGYMGASDAEAVELTVVDLRWQMVLDRLGETRPAFSQGALHNFRNRMIEHDMDRRLLERTAEVARRTKGFDAKKLPSTLRVAVDSAPLEGAGRVEDTINLLAHAARKVVICAAFLLGDEPDTICQQAGIPLLLASSVKRGLDRVWTAPGEKEAAISELTEQIDSLRRWLEANVAGQMTEPPLKKQLDTLEQIIAQDLEPDPNGGGRRIREGVSPDRRISIQDGEMRHGRKSKSKRIDGYKRHIAKDIDGQLIVACALTPANEPEQEALKELHADIETQGCSVDELYIDRGYVSSPIVGMITNHGGEVFCRPWRQPNRNLFTKDEFNIEIETMTVTCPAGQTRPARFGGIVSFGAACGFCLLRSKCTTASGSKGRSIRIAHDEELQQHLRAAASMPEGRQRLCRRVTVEHSLAHVVQRQGRRARYSGTRRNLYDLRRTCAIQNLETAQRKAA